MRTIALLALGFIIPASAQSAAPTQKESIESAANRCGRLDSRAVQLRWELNRLGDRARRGDPTLRMDMLRYVDEINHYAGQVSAANAAIKELVAATKPDADSIEASKNLHRQGDGLRAAANFLLNEIRWDARDLEQAGFTIEVFKIDQAARASFDATREILASSAEIRSKVQPASP